MAGRLGGLPYTDQTGEILSDADIYCMALSDQGVREWASRLRFPGKTVFHVSGSVPMETLDPVSEHCGVMYFFQTFSKEAPCPDLASTPVCIEASDDETYGCLSFWAERISRKVVPMDSSRRAVLHLGGVFVCNYANFMYTAAYDLLREKDVDFGLLVPLMMQTAAKAADFPPARVQTGPAVRGEREILQRQESYLESSSEGCRYLALYRLLARMVEERHREEFPEKDILEKFDKEKEYGEL